MAVRPLMVFLLALLATTAFFPAVPATHNAAVPVMEALAQDIKPGIRPGAWMAEPSACTFAFVVQDEEGATYITSAGHCVNRAGEPVTTRDEGEIGIVVVEGGRTDSALIKIHAHKIDRVDPTMIGWGGPTGGVTAATGGPQLVKHYGWGVGTWMNHQTRCRTALTHSGTWSDSSFSMFGTVLWGDSGSGTMTADGRALGLNTVLSVPFGTSAGPRFGYVLEDLGERTGRTLTLVTGAPVRDVCSLDD